MAIFGKLIDLQKQFKDVRGLDSVFKYLDDATNVNTEANSRICSMGIDQHKKIEIADGIIAIEQSYNVRKSDSSLFESHIKFVDFQLLILGMEIIEVLHIDLLKLHSEYDKENDYSLYKSKSNSSKILMQKGDLSILFPKDGHMPGIVFEDDLLRVHKTVVKVPYSILTT
jgi:YhcH/YjgK/YiaL family protein